MFAGLQNLGRGFSTTKCPFHGGRTPIGALKLFSRWECWREKSSDRVTDNDARNMNSDSERTREAACVYT